MPARSTATTEGQVAAIETCIADGAKGILHHRVRTPRASCRPIQKARDAGVLVIALDTPLEPIDSADHDLGHRQPSQPG
jgi:fructose transport system substrate-binding protein